MHDEVQPAMVWETVSAQVEVPRGRIRIQVEYFAGSLDEAYDWLRIGMEKATEAVLAQLGETFDRQ